MNTLIFPAAIHLALLKYMILHLATSDKLIIIKIIQIQDGGREKMLRVGEIATEGKYATKLKTSFKKRQEYYKTYIMSP